MTELEGRDTKEMISVVTAGHVDHGKSTVIGRLLADADALPEGKLDQVRESCLRNSKPFEYAFLLDALKAGRPGITSIPRALSIRRSALILIERRAPDS